MRAGAARRPPRCGTPRLALAPDLMDRNFRAEGAGRLWVADITHVRTRRRLAVVAVVVDAWRRRSWAGRWKRTCTPNWSSRPWRWRSSTGARWATPATTRCARASSRRSSASYSTAAPSPTRPRRAGRSSARWRTSSCGRGHQGTWMSFPRPEHSGPQFPGPGARKSLLYSELWTPSLVGEAPNVPSRCSDFSRVRRPVVDIVSIQCEHTTVARPSRWRADTATYRRSI